MKKRWIFYLASVILITAITTLFATAKPTVNSEIDTNIQPVTKEKLHEIFKDAIKEEKRNQRFSIFVRETAQEDMAVSKESSDHASDTSAGHSETNTQVHGVDESDIIKNDGDYIYQIIDGKLNIIKAAPASDIKLVHSLPFSHSFRPNQLFLYDDQLVVIGYSFRNGTPHDNSRQQKKIYPPSHYETTTAIVYNIKDPKNPEEIRKVEVDGNIVTSRRIDNFVYLVSNQYPYYWIMEDMKDDDIELRPHYSDTATDNGSSLVPYEKIHYIPGSKDTNFTLIVAFDLDNPTKEASITSYIGSGNQLYMSKENIYIAVTNYYAVPFRGEESDSPDTTVYKFSVDGEKIEFHRSTEVHGTILNQFSMDEHNGNFRVATTKGNTWNNQKPSANNLYIYDENLKQIGSLSDLARGERIYSARFMGERIYLVTFKQVDPLFVIDASNPKDPKVLGELKIPGFSNYLHPYDESHLIGFGHDTKVVADKGIRGEPTVYTDGVKISLFDIQDVNHPKEKFTEIIGGRGTYSPLNYDHKALLFSKEKGIFAFPITVYQNTPGKQYEQSFEFKGAYVYDINLEGINLKTRISHQTGPYETWEGEIQRVLTIGDTLYAISPTKITAHHIKDYNQIGEADLR